MTQYTKAEEDVSSYGKLALYLNRECPRANISDNGPVFEACKTYVEAIVQSMVPLDPETGLYQFSFFRLPALTKVALGDAVAIRYPDVDKFLNRWPIDAIASRHISMKLMNGKLSKRKKHARAAGQDKKQAEQSSEENKEKEVEKTSRKSKNPVAAARKLIFCFI